MTLAQDIIANTIPGNVYSPAGVAKILNYSKTSNVKKTMDDLIDYHYFIRWESPLRYMGRETYAYLRI